MESIDLIKLFIQISAISVFFWYFIKGLKKEIKSLKNTIETQNQTLVVMEKRVLETERIGMIYKNLISDLPNDLENYKKVITITRDQLINDLNQNIELKDKEIIKLKEEKISNLSETERILQSFITEIPNIQNLFSKVLTEQKNYAVKSAISQVIARNVPHNIGSQVLISIKKSTDDYIEIKNIKNSNKYLSKYFNIFNDIKTDFENISLEELIEITYKNENFDNK